MKIVIDIPEEVYNSIKSNEEIIKYITKDGRGSNQLQGSLAIINGTILPEGHGRLIDADELIKQLEATANIEWNMQVGSSKGLIDAIDIVDDIPTIIEADDGESD